MAAYDKDVVPDDQGATTWDFALTVDGFLENSPPLSDGEQHTFSDLAPDTYLLWETIKPG